MSEEDMEFIAQHRTGTFRESALPTELQDRAKRLADKAIFVRKKLDTDVQYALNRKIRFEKYGFKKT